MMGWRRLLRQRAVVNLKSGQAFSGIILRKSGRLVELADATLFEADHVPVPVDGTVVVERPNIAFINLVPPTTPAVVAKPASA